MHVPAHPKNVFVGSCAGLLFAVSALASPMRILVPPAPTGVDLKAFREPSVRARALVSFYLLDWFSRAPGVMAVDAPQASAVLGHVTSSALVGRDSGDSEGAVLRAVRTVMPVDAVFTLEHEDGQLTVALHRDNGTFSVQGRATKPADAVPLLEKVTQLVVKELRLSSTVAPLTAELPKEDAALTELIYITRMYTAPWTSNTGEGRLELLRPYVSQARRNPATAAAVMRAAAWLSLDKRKVVKPTHNVMLARQALPVVLGTRFEDAALFFCTHNHYDTAAVERDLLAVVERAATDGLDEVIADDDQDDGAGIGIATMASERGGLPTLLDAMKTPAQQSGAIRCLGVMGSQKALPHFERIASAETTELRTAVARALADHPDPRGVAILKTLLDDAEPAVAVAAAAGLLARDVTVPNAAALARELLERKPKSPLALEVLAGYGARQDVPIFSGFLNAPQAARRLLAVNGLLRIDAASGEDVDRWLSDPATAVIEATLKHLPGERVAAHRKAIAKLANHPYDDIAEKARLALAPLMPDEPLARARFELEIEHPYRRLQVLRRWAAAGTAEAGKGLVAATHNNDALTRARAITFLAERHPEAGRPLLQRLLADSHRRVRLHAAAAAAKIADVADRKMLEAALEIQIDDATKLYLRDAIARAGGPPVPPRPSVHLVSKTHNMSFSCGWSDEVERSAFDGFYGLNIPANRDAMRRAHTAGKVFLLRANETAWNPAQVFLAPGWRDGFWLGLEREFDGLWDAIDGIVLGEESMYFRRWNQWAGGWRLFCREAGIDARRIAGDRNKLNEAEKAAWWDWEQRVAIEGFNEIYDYVKLRFGRLRPGIQVATFMPDQNGPCAYDRQWKFDIAAGYYYAAGSRLRYATIRRMKTLWPERPVLWLNQGKAKVGLGLNLTHVGHRTPVPSAPFHSLEDVTTADSVCAWLAGGHTGLFAIYLFVHVGWKGEDVGRWVGLEDITPTSPVLQEALTHSFRGLGAKYQLDADIANAQPTATADGEEAVDEIELDDPTEKADPFAERAERERQAFRQGFLLERRFIQNPVNLLAGAAFPTHRREVLLIGPRERQVAGFGLFGDFDCLQQLHKLSAIPLGTYRFIGVTAAASAPLRDEMITALSRWLEAQNGILYVHGWLPTDNANELATVTDHDQTLQQNWPWEDDIEVVVDTVTKRQRQVQRTIGYVVRSNGRVLHDDAGQAKVVLWRRPGIKGAVLFAAESLTDATLRPHFESVSTELATQLALAPAPGVLQSRSDAYTAVVSHGLLDAPLVLEGVDALTGVREPALLKGRSAALTARHWQSRFAATANGLTVIGDAPIASAVTDDGLEVSCTGTIQAVAARSFDAVTENGALPTVVPNDVSAWLQRNEDGIVKLPRPDGRGSITLLRSAMPLTFRMIED